MSDADIRFEYDNLIKETDEAYLLEIDDHDYWFPKSVTRLYDKKNVGYAPEWLLMKKALI